MESSFALIGVENTLFIPLLVKAKEYTRKNAILRDEGAYELAKRLELNEKDFQINKYSAVSTLYRAKKFDTYAVEYMAQYPEGTIFEIGCGLDNRFRRIDNGKIKYVNIDLPEVIELRNKVIPKASRSLNSSSPIELFEYQQYISKKEPALIISEGVFPYFDKEMISKIYNNMKSNLGSFVLCFDVVHEYIIKKQSFKALDRNNVRMKWGIINRMSINELMPELEIFEEWRYYDKLQIRNGFSMAFKFVPFLNNLFKLYKLCTR